MTYTRLAWERSTAPLWRVTLADIKHFVNNVSLPADEVSSADGRILASSAPSAAGASQQII
jgi:hypothetical protein